MKYILSKEEIDLCHFLGLEIGYDIDDDQLQLKHLCWPYESFIGTLCKSDRLWGHAGPPKEDEEFSCDNCKSVLMELYVLFISKNEITLPNNLLIKDLFFVVGKLASCVNILRDVNFAAHDFVEILDNPEYEKLGEIYEKENVRKRLDKALETYIKS